MGLILWFLLGGIPALHAEPSFGGKVVIGAPGGLAPLNPVITSSTVSVNVFDVLFDRLLTETVTGEIAPGLAVSWDHSEDYRTWDFALRGGVAFHDGIPVTAEDVVFTFALLRQYRSKERDDPRRFLEFEAMEAIEPHRVRIRFAEPPPASFLYQMREPVLPKHIVEAQMQKEAIEEIPFNRHPVGSGPFQVDTWLGEAQLRLTAFEDYWGGRPYLDTVVVRGDYEDTQTLWAGLMREEVDVVSRAAHQDLESIAQNESFEIVRGVGPSFLAIAFNCRGTSLLTDRHLREALSYAIDRRAIWRRLAGSEEAVDSLVFPTGPFLPDSPFSNPRVKSSAYDPDKCAHLLDAAGWTVAEGSWVRSKERRALELNFVFPGEFPILEDVAALLRRDMEEVGIRLYVHAESYTSLYSQATLEEKSYDLLWIGGIFWYDPALCASSWHSADPSNYSGYANEEVDRLIEQGRVTYDLQKRVEIYRRFHLRMAADYPTLFICRKPLTYVRRKEIKGTELLNKVGTFRSLPFWYWDAVNNH